MNQTIKMFWSGFSDELKSVFLLCAAGLTWLPKERWDKILIPYCTSNIILVTLESYSPVLLSCTSFIRFNLHPLSYCVPKWFSPLFLITEKWKAASLLFRNLTAPPFVLPLRLVSSNIPLPGQEKPFRCSSASHRRVEASTLSHIIALMLLYNWMSGATRRALTPRRESRVMKHA